jgi:hypothetical protein
MRVLPALPRSHIWAETRARFLRSEKRCGTLTRYGHPSAGVPFAKSPRVAARAPRFPIPPPHRRILEPRRPRRIAGVLFEAFPVVHSLRAPAVGYRITAGGIHVFHVPDVLDIPARSAARGRVSPYIGDGASIVRPIVQRRGRRRFGHASIQAQIARCRGAGVRTAVFTHCGSQIVAGDEQGVVAVLARDGATIDA